jgi:lantibiotic biosynthesis protein
VTANATSSMTVLANLLSEQLATPPAEEPACAWKHQSLSQGAVGVAVLHGIRAQTGMENHERVHPWLSLAVRDGVSAGPGSGLWFGAPAVAFAISVGFPRLYTSTSKALNQAVADMTRTRLQSAYRRIAAAARPSLAEFDLVRGLTGLGAYLLHCEPDPSLLRQVLQYLVRLTEPVPAHDAAGTSAPGWWTSGNPNPATTTEGGHANLGMAHGICGPLALLALAARREITVAGQAEAADRICAWLDAWRQPGPAGPWWPTWVTLPELRTGRTLQSGPARPSWCYGTPGLARAQQLAAIAWGNRVRQANAENAIARCLSDPAQMARLTGPGLCHGRAGTALTAWHAACDGGNQDVGSTVESLALAAAESARAHPCGLINGSAGTALMLHTIALQALATWSGCLLIS